MDFLREPAPGPRPRVAGRPIARVDPLPRGAARPSDARARPSRARGARTGPVAQWGMPPVFDVRTLFFVGAIAAFACGAMLWLGRGIHAPSRAALAWAASSQWAFGAAMLLIALRGGVPDVLSYPVANALGSGAAALMYEGVRRYVGVRPLPAVAIATVLGLFALHATLGSDLLWFDLRLQLTSVVQGGFSAAAVPLLVRRLRSGEEAPGAIRWAIGFLGAFAVGHALRFGVVLAVGTSVAPNGLVEGPVQMLMPTLFALAPMGYAMILIGLVNGRMARELWMLATVDTLTGLRSRRAFIQEARIELDTPGARPVLLLLDVDRFKSINDRFGHAAGDGVLVRFAALLRDAVPERAVIGRYGGEEFCLLLPDATPARGLACARRICDTVRATPFGLAAPDPTVTVSIGLAASPDGTTLEELLLAADRRLYAAKASGRDRVVWGDRPPGAEPRPLPEPVTADEDRSDSRQTACSLTNFVTR